MTAPAFAPQIRLPSRSAIQAQLARKSLAEFFRQSWPVLERRKLIWNWHLEAICDHVQALIEGRIESRNLAINVPPGSSKPCDVNGRVIEKTRGIIRLADVNVGDSVLTHRGRFRLVTAVHEQGSLPILEITTGRGRVVRTAPDHPFLTARGWIAAQDLMISDVLAEVHASEECGTATISDREARLLGYLIGDGCLSASAAASFTNADRETLDDFAACAHSLGFLVSERRVRNTVNVSLLDGPSERTWHRRGGGGPVRAWIRRHGLERTNSYTKFVPQAVMAGTESIVRNFLAAYWACDGSISDRRDLPRASRHNQTLTTIRVDAVTVSQQLAVDLLALLSRVQLSFTLRRREAKLRTRRQSGGVYVSWHICCADQDGVARFVQTISPLIRHEKSRRAPGAVRRDFDRALRADAVKSVERTAPAECRCLTVDGDASFVFQGVAVHNSRIVSVCVTPWIWIERPEWSGIFTSANPRNVMRDSIYARQIIESSWYQETFRPSWAFARDQNAKGLYRNTGGGFRQAMGGGAKVTGDRADGLFMDDMLDATEGESRAARDAFVVWYDQAFANRVSDMSTSTRCIIAQRLHDADPVGHLLKSGEWEHLKIRQEYALERENPNDQTSPLIHRRPTSIGWTDPRKEAGELMDPIRFPAAELAKEKIRLGARGYAAQHQQDPVPGEGNIVKRASIRWYKTPRDGQGNMLPPLEIVRALGISRVVQGVDTALTEKTSSDNTADCTIGEAPSRFYVLDLWMQKVQSPAARAAVVAMHAKWKANAVIIEGGSSASGKATYQSIHQDTNLPVIEQPVISDKIVALNAVAPTIEACVVYFPEDQPWALELVESLVRFPTATHDDDVDALRLALGYLLFGGGATGLLDFMNRAMAAAAAAKGQAPAGTIVPTPPSNASTFMVNR